MMQDVKTPIVVTGVTNQPFFSIARLAGGLTFQGKRYKYIQPYDILIRQDRLKEFNKKVKDEETLEKYLIQIESEKDN